MTRRRTAAALPQVTLAAVAAALVVYPLLTLVITAAATGPTFGQLLLAPGSGRAWINTMWVGLAASLIAVSVAAGANVATAGVRSRLASAMRGGLLLPLLVPPFASAVGWSQAYGPGGLTDTLFHLPVRPVIGPLGVLLATAAEVMPIALLVLAGSAATRGDRTQIMAARASGSSRWDATLRVTLPLMRPALGAAAVLTFLAAVNNFSVPAVLGTPAGFETLTSRIYDDLNFATNQSAFVESQVLAAGLAVVSLLVLSLAGTLIQNEVRPVAPGPPAVAAAGSRMGFAAIALYLVLAVFGPLLALLLTAVTRAPGLIPTPANWGPGNFQQAISSARFLPALGNSLLLSVVAASVLVVLGLAVAFSRGRGGQAVAGAVTLGFAVPGSVVAVAFLLTYGRWIDGSLLIILLAYIAKLWALAHRPLAGALHGLPVDLRFAARASGARAGESVRTIVVPILAPTAAAAWVLVLLFALHEVTISSLLYGPTSQTLAVLVLNVEQVGDVGSTAALAVVLTALVVAPAAALALLFRRRAGRV